jgi:hypothetical protein
MSRLDRYGEPLDDDEPVVVVRQCAICRAVLSPENATRCCCECRLTAQARAFEDEVWLPVIGFPGWQISDHGRVRDSITRKVREPDRSHKYPRVCLNGHQRYVHHLMAESWLGPRPWGQQVLHGDDDPDNTHVANISYGTPTQNYEDSVRNGRRARKETPDEIAAKPW